MATYRIVCVETRYAHRHITHVGTGTDPAHANRDWTVAQVRSAIRDGDRFYTQSPSTNRTADVEPYNVVVNGETIYTIRSSPDAIHDNNLDNLRVCSWK
jgi:hypothetical protein